MRKRSEGRFQRIVNFWRFLIALHNIAIFLTIFHTKVLRWGAWVTIGVGVCDGKVRHDMDVRYSVWGRGRGEQGASNWTNKLTFFKIQIMLYFSRYHLSLWFCFALKKQTRSHSRFMIINFTKRDPRLVKNHTEYYSSTISDVDLFHHVSAKMTLLGINFCWLHLMGFIDQPPGKPDMNREPNV